MTGRTEREALDAIRELCDERERSHGFIRVTALREITAQVEPAITLTPFEAGMASSWFLTHPHGSLFSPSDDSLAERLRSAAGE